MAKRKKQRKPKSKRALAKELKASKLNEKDKKLRPIIFIAVFVLMLGGIIIYSALFEPVPNPDGGGAVDAYGRSTGHPHYGHDHP